RGAGDRVDGVRRGPLRWPVPAAAPPGRGGPMNRYGLRTLAREIAMLAVTAVVAFPLYILVNLSLRDPRGGASPVLPTTSPTLRNYADAWRDAGLAGAIVNSAVVTVLSIAIIVAASAMAAYPLARVTARWSRWVFLLVMLGLLLPFQLALLPLYQT